MSLKEIQSQGRFERTDSKVDIFIIDHLSMISDFSGSMSGTGMSMYRKFKNISRINKLKKIISKYE